MSLTLTSDDKSVTNLNNEDALDGIVVQSHLLYKKLRMPSESMLAVKASRTIQSNRIHFLKVASQ